MSNEERLCELLSEQLGLGGRINLGDRLVADLNCDSMDLVEIAMAVEDEFAIDVPDDEGEACVTVADCLALINKKLAA